MRIIAAAAESKANAPHFYLTVDCEIDNLLAARRMNDKAGEGVKISVNDLIIRAAAMAVPKANTGKVTIRACSIMLILPWRWPWMAGW